MNKLIYGICFLMIWFVPSAAYRYGYEYALKNFSEDEYRSRDEILEYNPVMWEILFGTGSTDQTESEDPEEAGEKNAGKAGLVDPEEAEQTDDGEADSEDPEEAEQTDDGEANSENPENPAGGNTLSGYYLMASGKFVLLYQADRKTVYMEMGIYLDDFPETWTESLKSGIYFESLSDALYLVERIRAEKESPGSDVDK